MNFRFDEDTLKIFYRELRFPDVVRFDNWSVMPGEEVLPRGLYELQRCLVENGRLIFLLTMYTIIFHILCMSKYQNINLIMPHNMLTSLPVEFWKLFFAVPIVFMHILFTHVKIVVKFKMHLIIINYCGDDSYHRRCQKTCEEISMM